MSLTNFNTQIIGRLGNDAKSRQVGEYFAISFSLPISENKSNGEQITQWINCTYWSKTEKMLQYLTKGKLVSVVSDFYNENEKDGKKYSNFRVRDINPFLEKSDTKQDAPQGNFTEKSEKPINKVEQENPFTDEEDDDLVF